MKIRWLLIFSSLATLACAPPPKNEIPEAKKEFKQYEKVVTTPNPYTTERGYITPENSLYDGDFNLYTDVKAHRRGDIVYIIVTESVDALQQISTQTGKQGSIDVGISSFFGISRATLRNLSAKGGFQTGEKYGGSTHQSGVLTTRLAAFVKKVYPNGNMLIEASRYIYMNEGGHRIILRGIVRPQDIGPDNSVPSSRIANLEIIYDGRGYMVDASSPGWLVRFFQKINPF
jgi:flagellar L-ring protein precursor FlgH